MFATRRLQLLSINPHSVQVVPVDRLWSKECAAISANLANTTTSAPSYVNHAILNGGQYWTCFNSMYILQLRPIIFS